MYMFRLLLYDCQHVGPFIMDTTEPVVEDTRVISVDLNDDFLVALWPSDTFSDDEEPYQLKYEYALGKQYSVHGFTLSINKHNILPIPQSVTVFPLVYILIFKKKII